MREPTAPPCTAKPAWLALIQDGRGVRTALPRADLSQAVPTCAELSRARSRPSRDVRGLVRVFPTLIQNGRPPGRVTQAYPNCSNKRDWLHSGEMVPYRTFLN